MIDLLGEAGDVPAGEGVGDSDDGDDERGEEEDGGEGWASEERVVPRRCLHRKLVTGQAGQV